MQESRVLMRQAVNQAKANGVEVTAEQALADLERAARILLNEMDTEDLDPSIKAKLGSAYAQVAAVLQRVRAEVAGDKEPDDLTGLTDEELELRIIHNLKALQAFRDKRKGTT